jgi:hypothetical protein
MKIFSTLMLVGALAALVPQTTHAGGRKLVVMHPTGTVNMDIKADGVNVSYPLPIIKGRIEIQEGPYVPGLGKQFMLTKFIVGVHPFMLNTDKWGRMTFFDIGLHMPNAVSWWAQLATTGPNPLSTAYEIYIPPDDIYTVGDPTFVATGLVIYKGEARNKSERDRVSKPITGVIDFDHGTVTINAVLEAKTPAPWWDPFSSGIKRKFTISLKGVLPSPGYAQVDPEEPPSPPRPIMVPANPSFD